MALTAGARVGAYEIVDLLGAGGMGEVYRARDTKLKRDVAIKILPETFAHDADRLARFQREAETLATLSHPNIAVVHGLEESGDVAAIVMELVDGESLADRCARGRLAVDDALDLARQIADALETAHDRGVIHRDLKPANIKVTPGGVAKVLDFGLAKMLEADGSGGSSGARGSAASMSPTLSVHATMQGVILGTAAYMSPEQARGKPVDRRTDIWAFGCVLFEMLTGKQVFAAGETVTDTVAAIIKNEPDWNALPSDTPAHIRSLLRRCLQKDVKRRLPHIGVARIEIEEGASVSESGPPAMSTAPHGSRPARRALPWVIAGIAVAAAATLAAALLRPREPVAQPPVRFTIDPPEGATFGTNVALRGAGPAAPQFALSPDGRRLAYVMYTGDGKPPRMWLRRLDALEGQPLPGTEEAAFPFWAPDSRVVGFFAQGKLKKIDTAGGPVLTICDAPAGEGGTWNGDGVILFAPDQTTGLSRVSDSGGVATAVTTLDKAQGELSHRWPQFLPDGRHFVFLAMRGQVASGQPAFDTSPANRITVVGSLDAPQRTTLLQGSLRSVFAAGNLLFLRDDTLMAQAFDVSAFRLSGEPTAVAEHVASNSGNGRTGFTASDSGALVYRSGLGLGTGGLAQLAWFNREGKRLEQVGQSAPFLTVQLAPDDTRVATYIRDTGDASALGDLWSFDLARGGISTRLTLTPGVAERGHAWSPDGSRIAYASGADEAIYQKPTAGVGDPERLAASGVASRAASWSPDGKFLLVTALGSTSRTDILLLPTTGDRKLVPFTRTEFDERSPVVAPDSRWVAFDSDKSGRFAIYVRPFPTGDREWLVASDGIDPQWRGDGKELFYVSLPQRSLMAIPVQLGQTPEFGVPVKLFDAPIFAGQGQYGAASNGQRFLLIERADPGRRAASVPMTVVLHWTAPLKNRD